MSRTYIASYAQKCADINTGMDILARAQFWEGASGALPFKRIRGMTSPSLLLRLIRDLMEEVSPGLTEQPDMDIWFSTSNTKLYAPVLRLADTILAKFQMEGNDILQADMARDDILGSVFYSAGKQTAKHKGDELAAGVIFPSDAQVVARRFIARHAIDAVRAIRLHQKLEQEKGDFITQQAEATSLDKDDWVTVIDRLLSEPDAPLAQDFFKWLRSEAVAIRSPILLAYLDNVFQGGEKSQSELAAELGVTDVTLSQAKRRFFDGVATQLAAGKKAPAILNILSDADFLSGLLKGKVKAPYTASQKSAGVDQEADLRKQVIRLASTNPALRPHLLPLLK